MSTTQHGAPGSALRGIRVADFSRVLAGPYAAMMLGDLGADVIKIEGPEGDGTRQWKPPINAAGESTYFAGTNRNKRSIVLDLKNADDLARAKELATTADVVIHNFKPGTMEKFELGYEELAKDNPGLIYCAISGFGEDKGRDLPGYDLLVQAVGGLMSITGRADGEPTKVGVALVDVITGLNAVIGIQTSLISRAHTGVGQYVQVDLLTSLLSALVNQASSTLETGNSPSRIGNAHPSIAPYETLRARDTDLAVAVGTDAQFQALCRVLGEPELASDERYLHNENRVAHRPELRADLERLLAANDTDYWAREFTAANVPAGKVNTIAEAIDLAENLGLNPVANTPLDANGTTVNIRTIANPIKLSGTPASYHTAPPALGAHQGATWLDTKEN